MVKVSYQRCKEANGGLRPNLQQVARDCSVSPNYVKKIEGEILTNGRGLHPEEKKQEWKIGPGANTIDALDSFVLLRLYLMEDSRTLPSYGRDACTSDMIA